MAACWIALVILFAWRNLQFGLDTSPEVRTGSGVGGDGWGWVRVGRL